MSGPKQIQPSDPEQDPNSRESTDEEAAAVEAMTPDRVQRFGSLEDEIYFSDDGKVMHF